VDRRTLLKAGLLAPAAASLPVVLGQSAAGAAPRVDTTLVSGVSFPWGVDFLPDGSALVTLRNSGDVLHVQPDGGSSLVGTVPGAFNDGGEGGLMGLALSPAFATDRLVYAYLTTRTDNRILRMPYAGGELGPAEVVLSGIPRNRTHNGGGLWFTRGDRPSLFVGTGDTRRPELAQDRGSLAGKILRLKPDGTAQTGNPFGTRVYSYGHRNPEGITVGPDSKVWSSELGENTWDELNHIRPGRNYGWARVEGRDGPGGYTDPLAQWHPDSCSPSAVAIRTGLAWVGALKGQSLWSVVLAGPRAGQRTRWFHGRFGRIRMVKLAPDHSLWIGTSNGGGTDRVIRLTFG
jgi:glucose/arabinose dehydrogenase